MELPYDLRTALDDVLSTVSPKKLGEMTTDLSKRYRSGLPQNGEKFLKSTDDILAYAAFRMPATFAAVHAVLGQLHEILPDFCPQTILDVGAGPGTAMWAVAAMWPIITNVTLLEREADMITLGKKLASYSSLTSVLEAKWIKADITCDWNISAQDLVIASYSLGELTQNSFQALVHKLWEKTNGTLVIIEPGTPAGFSRIKQAREQLMAEGANTIAPCPHNQHCPMKDDDWCHFSQRIARSRLHRQVKSGEMSYEDEKFSFVIMSRLGISSSINRVIRHPQVRKAHIHFELCTPEGLKSTIVTRGNKELYRKARDLQWGSAMPLNDDKE